MAALDTRRNNGIRICLLRNGDKRFYKPYVMNPRSTRTIDSFMDDVTTIVRMPVRKVFTPNHGHRIRTLEQLQSNGSYVVAGGEPFKKIGYSDVKEPGIQRLPPSKELEIVVPARHGRYRNVPGRARNYADSKPQGILTIYVFCNGLKFSQSRKVMFPRSLNMNQILECVNEKVSSVMGAVFYLFRKSDGVRISEPSKLENKELYVAVGRDGHLKKNVIYGDGDQVRRTSTKPITKKVQPPDKTGPRKTRKKKSIPAQRVEPAKASDEESKGFSGSEDSPREYRTRKIELEEQEVKEEELIKEESSYVGDSGVPLHDILNERKQSLGVFREPAGYEASGDDVEDAQEIMADHSEPREPEDYEDSGNDAEDVQEIVDDQSESREPAGYEASGNDVENAQEVVDDHSEPVEQVRQVVSNERRNSEVYEASGNDTEDAHEVYDEQNELAAQDRQGGGERRDSEVKPSVYEASGDQQEDGVEIKDDRETKEDKPIDQMSAEEVTEEEIAEEEPQPKQDANENTRLDEVRLSQKEGTFVKSRQRSNSKDARL